MHSMISGATASDAEFWASLDCSLDLKEKRSARFAELMFDALDQAFCALGHPDPIGQLRYVAELRRDGGDPSYSLLEDQRIDLVAGFAAEILSTASRYAALLERLEKSRIAPCDQSTVTAPIVFSGDATPEVVTPDAGSHTV